MSERPAFEPARPCAGCTMCCKLLGIAALDKPAGQWCSNCEIGQGCKIYATRPEECREFFCAYVADTTLPEIWAPRDSKLIVSADPTSIVVFVDPDRADAWRQEPFYSEIMRWGKIAPTQKRKVLVIDGSQTLAILPQGEKPLGVVAKGSVFSLMLSKTPEGDVYDVIVTPP